MPGLSEAPILEDATDAEHVQKLTIVLEIAAHAEQDHVFFKGGYFRNYGKPRGRHLIL